MISISGARCVQVGDEVARSDAYGVREADDNGKSRVAKSALNLGHVHEAHCGALCDIGLRQPLAASKFTQTCAESAADARVPVVGHRRIVRTTTGIG